MRREYLTVHVDDAGADGDDARTNDGDDDQPPVLAIRVDRPAGSLPDFLCRDPAANLGGGDVDVVLRRGKDDDAVLSLARRLTGEFLLEANVEASVIESLVAAARDRQGEPRFRVTVEGDEFVTREFEKRTLLVFDADGNIERETSLIPSGVEL